MQNSLLLAHLRLKATLLGQDSELIDLDDALHDNRVEKTAVIDHIGEKLLPDFRAAVNTYLAAIKKTLIAPKSEVAAEIETFKPMEERLSSKIVALNKSILDEDIKRLTAQYLQIMNQTKPTETNALDAQAFLKVDLKQHLETAEARLRDVRRYLPRAKFSFDGEMAAYDGLLALLTADSTEVLANARYQNLLAVIRKQSLSTPAAYNYLTSSILPIYESPSGGILAASDAVEPDPVNQRGPASVKGISQFPQQLARFNKSRLAILAKMAASCKNNDVQQWFEASRDWEELSDNEFQRSLRGEVKSIAEAYAAKNGSPVASK